VLTFANNLWGAPDGLEAQRQDLWLVNLKPAIVYFSSLTEEQFNAVGLSKDDLPNEDTTALYAIRVTLPVQKITPRSFIQGTVPRNLPSYVDALDTARVDFLHEGQNTRSPIYTLLQMWRSIVRIGRVGMTGETTFLLPDETFKPQYKFDVVLQLLSGDTSDVAIADMQFSADLTFSAQYTLIDCWPRIVQQGIVDRTKGAQLHVLSAQFALQEII
jgi:hypothetical protein